MLFNSFDIRDNTMKRYHIIYEGIVQGVGFRWKLIMIARSLNLTGYAKNLNNGNVEVEVQGREESLNEFIKKSLEKDHFVQIYDYAIKDVELKEKETIFDVIY